MEKSLREKLERPVSVEFIETPLVDIVDFLALRGDLPLPIDRRSLEQAKISADQLATVKLVDVRLATLLDGLLKPMALQWYVDDAVAWIIATGDIEQANRTRAFSIADLLPDLSAERAGSSLRLDELSLERSSVDLDHPVTLRAQQWQIRSALQRVLAPRDASWTAVDNVLVIHGRGDADYIQLRLYPVADLLDAQDGSRDPRYPHLIIPFGWAPLDEELEEVCQPRDGWADGGGESVSGVRGFGIEPQRGGSRTDRGDDRRDTAGQLVDDRASQTYVCAQLCVGAPAVGPAARAV